jgi:hypothetical protein
MPSTTRQEPPHKLTALDALTTALKVTAQPPIQGDMY